MNVAVGSRREEEKCEIGNWDVSQDLEHGSSICQDNNANRRRTCSSRFIFIFSLRQCKITNHYALCDVISENN